MGEIKDSPASEKQRQLFAFGGFRDNDMGAAPAR